MPISAPRWKIVSTPRASATNRVSIAQIARHDLEILEHIGGQSL